MKPYYEDDYATIYHGDCREVLPTLGPVDLTITSPPYNMGLVPGGNGRGMYRPGASNKAGRFRDGYGEHDDAMPQAEYNDWLRTTLALAWERTLLALFLNHRPRVEHGALRVPLSFDFGELGQPRQIIVWDRGTGIDVNLRNFCTRQEWIILFATDRFKLCDHATSGMGDVWRLGMEHAETGHPAPFPLSLPARCIAATADASSVLDPFMGSGTTLRAAKDAGVRSIGIEINEAYCEVAAKRLAQESIFGSVVEEERAQAEELLDLLAARMLGQS